MPGGPRLLITVPPTDPLRGELGRVLPDVPFLFASGDESGPWPDVEAILTADPRRELPGWATPSTPNVRFVQRVFTGLDGFPFDLFPPEVAVAGNGGGYAPFVAEHAIALLLALAHHLPENFALARAGKLHPRPANRYLPGETALLLGFGSIGRELAGRLRAFGMRVEGVSRLGSPDPLADRMYAAVDLGNAVAGADVVIECRPLTNRTRGTLDASVMARFRPQAILINIGRAATVDESALFDHLQRHPEFRVGTDVWWDEDHRRGEFRTRFPFAELPNFLGTPHVAGMGTPARRHAETTAVANLARFFAGEPPRYVADRSEYR